MMKGNAFVSEVSEGRCYQDDCREFFLSPPEQALSPAPKPVASFATNRRHQQQPNFIDKILHSFAKVNETCQFIGRSFSERIRRVDSSEHIEKSMAGEVQLRMKKAPSPEKEAKCERLGDEWLKRVSDYHFLSGKEELPRRRNSVFARVKGFNKQSRRRSIIDPPRRNKNDEPGYQCAKCKKVVHKSCMNSLHKCDLPVHQGPLSIPTSVTEAPRFPGYGDLQIKNDPWWAERMTRDDATLYLGLSPEGTFLLRWSERHEKLVLSLKAMGEVKHMRVFRQDGNGFFYLSEARYFTALPELINFYRQSPLSESFTGLDCCLRRPFYDTAIVKFPYLGTGPSHLSLVPGQRVVIMSREGENRGWWKGRIDNHTGYFPREYVTLENDDTRLGW